MLGCSVYLGNRSDEEQETYLKEMSQAGFQFIFTSLHILEDDRTHFKDLLKTLGRQARTYNMDLVADISPVSFQLLGFTPDTIEEIKTWGVNRLRLDYGLEPITVAKLSHTMKIALNASTITLDFVQDLLKANINLNQVEAWHNYYPRIETGLDKNDFIKQNIMLKKLGFKVMAFVPGDKLLRGPLNEGLPTLEQHRNEPPFQSFLELIHECNVDKVAIGDISLQKDTLLQFEKMVDGSIPLRSTIHTQHPPTKSIIALKHHNRMDAARDVIRSKTSRTYTANKNYIIHPENTTERAIGSITIDNERYGRYHGELQIVKKNLPINEKVNVVGRVIEQDINLLKYIKSGQGFTIINILLD
ncbi:DUF871 domain-containing protein [Bacillus cihuensis]|uniref:DUF871 domain-containing protein n=1 Tax=Bacillus cihuensis TaxID=1208599 RepID=UPI0004077658|nr:MupG family TIM beta-alpha barrel fold protein [Bacillus cihuensis]